MGDFTDSHLMPQQSKVGPKQQQKTRVGVCNTYNFVIHVTDKGLCLE